MTVALILVLVVVLTALVFEYINGFHDTANSIATVVATKVLTPTQAVALAASMNLVGALMGTAVAKTISEGILDAQVVEISSQLIICALAGGIVWNLITWFFGLPSSSSHALIGGLVGAGLAAASNDFDALIWSQEAASWTKSKGILWKVVVPMITSPVVGFTLGLLLMGALMAVISSMNGAGGWIARISRPSSPTISDRKMLWCRRPLSSESCTHTRYGSLTVTLYLPWRWLRICSKFCMTLTRSRGRAILARRCRRCPPPPRVPTRTGGASSPP